jgi:hypothetical protein
VALCTSEWVKLIWQRNIQSIEPPSFVLTMSVMQSVLKLVCFTENPVGGEGKDFTRKLGV